MTVHAIDDGYPIKNSNNVNQDLIDGLESLLKDAHNGEIVGLTGAIQYGDNATGGFAFGFRKITPIIGALQRQIIKMATD